MYKIGKKDLDGFLLLELMVSIAILAIGLIGVIRAFSISLYSAEESRKITHAVLLSHKILNEVKGIGDIEETEGEENVRNSILKWHLDREEPSSKGLDKVDIKVTWLSRGVEKELNIETYMNTKKEVESEKVE